MVVRIALQRSDTDSFPYSLETHGTYSLGSGAEGSLSAYVPGNR